MGVTVSDLTANYQRKIDDIQSMISAIPEDLQKVFRIAVNLYDAKQREIHADEYIAWGMKALGLLGWYYDYGEKQWVNAGYSIKDEKQYRDLYGERVRDIVPLWYIIDADPDIKAIQNAGEMQGDFELGLQIVGGEQGEGDKSTIQIPDIPISSKANVAEMTKGDNSDDKFIYAYSDSGVSKNKRNWRPVIMDSIARQVMELLPPGHYGHMKPQDVGYAVPSPVVTWIGATTERLSDDVTRLWLKGYIIPLEDGNNLKTYIRTQAVDSISVWGGLTLLPNEETGISDVLDIDLKSIDISGKLKEGLHSSIVKTAGEMEEGDPPPDNPPKQDDKKGGNNSMDRAEIIKGLTVADIQMHNPGLLDGLKQSVMDAINVDAKNRTMLAAAGEMATIEQETGKTGAEATAYVKSIRAFAGEMEAVLEMPTGSPFADIISKVKDTVAKSGVVDKISEAIHPAKDQDVLARATELAQAEQVAKNTAAIQAVKDKFTELTADVTNDVIKEMIADSFASVLDVKPEGLSADFQQTAIAQMTEQMPTVKEKVVNRAKSLLEAGKAAGEMAMFDNLGVGKGAQGGTPDTSKMSDEEYAKYLGYGG